MQILFYDATTPIAYTTETLTKQALRGTEATILRIAKALSSYHQVYIAQHCRETSQDKIIDNIHFISFATAHQLSPDVVILLRQQQLLETTAKQFPKSRLFFWMHNMPPRDLFKKRNTLQQYHYEIIAVSHFHREKIVKRLQGKWYQRFISFTGKKNIPVHVLYNPIDEELNPNGVTHDPNQLIFTSSPYKGLAETLNLFAALREHFPEYKLKVTNPDPSYPALDFPENVILLGSLPQQQLLDEIRKSFCVFYPQTERLETFGLVYAEANAVGIPVLAHNFGAASEVLSDPSQLIDGNNFKNILAKISEWRENRPHIKPNEKFRLSRVVNEWKKLLEG